MHVTSSWTFGLMTGAMPTPPSDAVSLRSFQRPELNTIFEFDFTQNAMTAIF
jgi:hypothetical protein